MKVFELHLLFRGAALFLAVSAAAQPASSPAPEPRKWWQGGGFPPRRVENPTAKALPLISVKGNKFVNPAGETVLFRGLSIADPDKLDGQGHWNKAFFEHVKEMGATLVRIPVHPIAWRERTPPKYLELLDQGVAWCTDLGLYVIIDWHSIGNLRMELFQNPMYNTTRQETYEFWRMIARRFNGHNTVAFYEIFNEPTLFRGQLGRMSWSEWRQINEDIIALIRAWDKDTIPLVAGLDGAYDLSPIRDDPVNAEGIAYVTHPYPNKRPQPWEPKWEEDFGFAAGRHPVIATEFGFNVPDGEKIGDDHYGPRVVKYFESHGISWLAWVYDPAWGPRLLKSWDNFELTGYGDFIKQALHGNAPADSAAPKSAP